MSTSHIETASGRILDARERLPALLDEIEMLGTLMCSFESDDPVPRGVTRLLGHWLDALVRVSSELAEAQEALRTAADAEAGRPDPEPTPAERFAVERRQSERLMDLAQAMAREAEQRFAAAIAVAAEAQATETTPA